MSGYGSPNPTANSTETGLSALLDAAASGTPGQLDELLFRPSAVSRVVRGTCSDAPDDIGNRFTIGAWNPIISDLDGGFGDAAAFAAGIVTTLDNGALSAIPALSAVDNEDGTFDITFEPGVAANGLETSTEDPHLTFDEITAGADAGGVKKTTRALLNKDVVIDVISPLTIDADNYLEYMGVRLNCSGAQVTFNSLYGTGFNCKLTSVEGSTTEIVSDMTFVPSIVGGNAVKATGDGTVAVVGVIVTSDSLYIFGDVEAI